MILILFLSILSILLPDFDFVSPENPVDPEIPVKLVFACRLQRKGILQG